MALLRVVVYPSGLWKWYLINFAINYSSAGFPASLPSRNTCCRLCFALHALVSGVSPRLVIVLVMLVTRPALKPGAGPGSLGLG